jgi:hypothetical protein
MKQLFRFIALIVASLIYSIPASADPEHVRVMLLTVVFDNATGEVVTYYINGFDDKEACTAKSMAITATAEDRAGPGKHVGMSLCFGDATVYGGKAAPQMIVPPGEQMVPAIPEEAKGPITDL